MARSLTSSLWKTLLLRLPLFVWNTMEHTEISLMPNQLYFEVIQHVVDALVKDLPSYDRTTINAWEDVEFLEAVKATKRKKLIMAALWTEACLLFPTLDALKEGYEVYPVVDAVAGTSIVAHDAALRRMEKAGAQPVSLMGLICEIQRDWARSETIPAMLGVLAGVGNNVGLDIEGQGLERESK